MEPTGPSRMCVFERASSPSLVGARSLTAFGLQANGKTPEQVARTPEIARLIRDRGSLLVIMLARHAAAYEGLASVAGQRSWWQRLLPAQATRTQQPSPTTTTSSSAASATADSPQPAGRIAEMQQVQELRLKLEQERQARAAADEAVRIERERRQALEVQLEQERLAVQHAQQARIAAEEALHHDRAQGTHPWMLHMPSWSSRVTDTWCAKATASTVMRLFVRPLPKRDPIEIQYLATDTVGHIKASMAHRLSCSIAQLRLLFGGRELDQDFQPLTAAGINN